MKKILVAEDNEANMKLFCDLLKTQKYDITMTYDGKSTLEKLKNSNFDLLILDIQLPKMSGLELMDYMRKHNIKRPPTLVVSAFAMDNEIRVAKMYGCEHYMTKPIDVIKFLNTVKSVLENGENNV